MGHKNYIKIFTVMVMLCLTSGLLQSQTVTDPEEEYARIRTLAFEGKYPEAEPAARLLVS